MAYNFFPAGYQPQTYPQMYPQNTQQMTQQQSYPQPAQQNGIVWVQGIEGAKSHPVSAGQAVLLMDSEANCLYLKSADQTGMPSLRIFDYTERTQTPPDGQKLDVTGFISKDELSHYATKDDVKSAILALKEEMGVAHNESNL